MTEPAPAAARPVRVLPKDAGADAGGVKPAKQEESFLAFLVKLVLIVVILRSFIFAPFNIPSESMLPRLLDGDYLLAAKWPYGFSRYSLPFSVPLIPGRILPHQPDRGDVVIFKAPADMSEDWIKRVIGLPGDQVQMVNGQLFLNGRAVPKVRIADFVVPVSPNTHCSPSPSGFPDAFARRDAAGHAICSYPQFRETLPGGKSYNVLDFGATEQDNTPPVIVPEGHVFVMGDNRDNSTDSRFSPARGGVGLLPQENLVGRAMVMMFSTDGGAEWLKPWTWVTAARWRRIGGTF